MWTLNNSYQRSRHTLNIYAPLPSAYFASAKPWTTVATGFQPEICNIQAELRATCMRWSLQQPHFSCIEEQTCGHFVRLSARQVLTVGSETHPHLYAKAIITHV